MNGTAHILLCRSCPRKMTLQPELLGKHVCSVLVLAIVAILTSSIMSIWQSLRGSATQSKA